MPANRSLLYWAGRAYDLAAKQHLSRLQSSKAQQARARAMELFERALATKDVSERAASAGTIFRAMALCAETADSPEQLKDILNRWQKTAPREIREDWQYERLMSVLSTTGS